MELNLNSFHDDTVQVTALRGEYGGVVELDTMVQLSAVFSFV
jgi:hypothetical protein